MLRHEGHASVESLARARAGRRGRSLVPWARRRGGRHLLLGPAALHRSCVDCSSTTCSSYAGADPARPDGPRPPAADPRTEHCRIKTVEDRRLLLSAAARFGSFPGDLQHEGLPRLLRARRPRTAALSGLTTTQMW